MDDSVSPVVPECVMACPFCDSVTVPDKSEAPFTSSVLVSVSPATVAFPLASVTKSVSPLTPSDAQSYALGHSDIEEVDHRILEFLKARFANPRTARSMASKAHQSGRELLRELHKINAVVMAKGSGEDYINGEQRRLEALQR